MTEDQITKSEKLDKEIAVKFKNKAAQVKLDKEQLKNLLTISRSREVNLQKNIKSLKLSPALLDITYVNEELKTTQKHFLREKVELEIK